MLFPFSGDKHWSSIARSSLAGENEKKLRELSLLLPPVAEHTLTESAWLRTADTRTIGDAHSIC